MKSIIYSLFLSIYYFTLTHTHTQNNNSVALFNPKYLLFYYMLIRIVVIACKN